jgi:hypothetical protein
MQEQTSCPMDLNQRDRGDDKDGRLVTSGRAGGWMVDMKETPTARLAPRLCETEFRGRGGRKAKQVGGGESGFAGALERGSR